MQVVIACQHPSPPPRLSRPDPGLPSTQPFSFSKHYSSSRASSYLPPNTTTAAASLSTTRSAQPRRDHTRLGRPRHPQPRPVTHPRNSRSVSFSTPSCSAKPSHAPGCVGAPARECRPNLRVSSEVVRSGRSHASPVVRGEGLIATSHPPTRVASVGAGGGQGHSEQQRTCTLWTHHPWRGPRRS
ncbi:hypothetical protein BC628DRAFT_38462 [Trametes gibbosa]|nr:hypothetical protein BC628DRAFT_38462 [Trametes gibbosa]